MVTGLQSHLNSQETRNRLAHPAGLKPSVQIVSVQPVFRHNECWNLKIGPHPLKAHRRNLLPACQSAPKDPPWFVLPISPQYEYQKKKAEGGVSAAPWDGGVKFLLIRPSADPPACRPERIQPCGFGHVRCHKQSRYFQGLLP